jgi:glutaryl-CoA dehydrogenase
MNCYAELDPLASATLLTDAERRVRDEAAAVVDERLLPLAADAFERGAMPDAAVRAIAELGGFGEKDPVLYGLRMQELERADSGFRSCASVQSSLVMWPLANFGSPEQQKWLAPLQRGEALGCFALTEPLSGSDPGSMTTRAVQDGPVWRLTGHKRWATNGLRAEVAIVWAKTSGDDARSIRGFVVETAQPGLVRREIAHKMSLRASESAELLLDGAVGTPLPGAAGLGAPLKCLNEARFGIAWGAVGAATACFASARDYVKERKQFGKPLGAFQLVQEKLARIYTDIGFAQLACIQLGRLKQRKELTPVQVSFATRPAPRATCWARTASRSTTRPFDTC